MVIRFFLWICFLLCASGISAQAYTFECVSGSRLTGDSCDICPTTIVESRSFNGLVIYRDSAFWRWVDQPYSIRVKPGGIVEYWEHSVNPYSERITVPLAATGFFTVQGMADSTWCNSSAPQRFPVLEFDSLSPTLAKAWISGSQTGFGLRALSGVTFSYSVDTLGIAASGGGLDDGDKGDITVSSGGTVWTIDNEAVSNAKFRNSVGTSVVGRAANSTGSVADIVASTSGHVLRRTDTALSFGQVVEEGIANNAVTTGKIADAAVTLAKIQNFDALSVLGRSANSAGVGGFIAAGTDAHVLRRSGTTLGFGQVATGGITDLAVTTSKIANSAVSTDKLADIAVTTAKIANDAVTYAKMQNAAANNILLGNNNGAGTDFEELTVAQIYTLLGMTGVANRFALWTGANTIGNDEAFTFDAANDRMTVAGTVAGTGANNAFLNLNSGAITGATEFLRMSGNISGNMLATMFNSNNANAGRHTIFQILSGGNSSGDAAIQFTVNGVMTHVIGIDNTDDRFKITPNATTPGGNANMGIIVRDNAGTGNVGINIDFPTHPLTVEGRGRADLWMGEGNLYNAGNVTFGNGAGTGPALNQIIGTGNGVMVTFTTGTTPTANGNIFTITYPTSFITRSMVVFSAGADNSGAAGDNAATDINKFKINASTAGDFIFKAVGTLSASTQYAVTFNFWGY
jgi:hypothetical protein